MRMTRLVGLVSGGALVFALTAATNLSFAAEDGAALYKTYCANCHKDDGGANTAMKAPAIKGKSVAEVTKTLHTALNKSQSADMVHTSLGKKLDAGQIKAIAAHIASMK
jgi:cytochrome c553